MRALVRSLPIAVILIGIGAMAMLLPAAHAASVRDWPTMRVFLSDAGLFAVLAGLLGLASAPWRPAQPARARLLALLGAYAGLPLMLAVPFWHALPGATFLESYFEMLSSLTTTGATLYDDPARIPATLHLWRAEVGWMGGFFMWVIAVAVFQPLDIGGFEVLSGATGHEGRAMSQIARIADSTERIARFSVLFFPVYAGLTGALWLALVLTGDASLTALCHAMSTLSTSGISPVAGGVGGAASGRAGEVVIFLFLVFALSQQTFAHPASPGSGTDGGLVRAWRDPEFRLGLFIIAATAAFLFLRHWIGAYELSAEADAPAALAALWGALFSAGSFLTTTGFVSADWLAAQRWSGLPAPGIILMGLALVGGGVATAAGGIKLLRVYALWKHIERELEKLTEPHSVAGAGTLARHLRRRGAYIAWIFFMLYGLSLASVALALALAGADFEDSIVLAVAALSTTGQVALIGGSDPLSYAGLGDGVRMILAAAMVLGRVELLAIVALLNPDFWRR